MSCLPLFSFSPNLSAVLKPYDTSSDSGSDEQRTPHTAKISSSTDVVDGRYDKLSRVSMSHRRVDSFEWVMTQSAPNSPPTSLDPKHAPFSPPPIRRVGSAPLPVPRETWSTKSQTCDKRQTRGYFDWLSSPILGFNTEYTKVSTIDNEDRTDLECSSSGRQSSSGPSQPPTSPYLDFDEVRPSQEINALGIVFPSSTPAKLPIPSTQKRPEPKYSSRAAGSRLPKRVSFSPVIHEAGIEAFPEFGSATQPPLTWGSYLPSSFLVARPPLTRTASSPVSRSMVATRPILKRSVSSDQQTVRQPRPGTEMIRLSPKFDTEDPLLVASPIPTQRLSVATLRTNGHRQVGTNPGETDSAFVAVLQATNKPTRQRCDSLLSVTTLSPVNGCK